MKKQREQQLNNAGFSLVELIVSVLITGFITGMIVAFISISRRTYENINTEAVLQTEASMATNYINELLLEAQDCGSGTFTYTNGSGESCTAKVIWIKAPNNSVDDRTNACDYFIIQESDTGRARFCRRNAVDDTKTVIGDPTELAGRLNAVIGDKYALLAEHVTDMTITPNVTGETLSSGTLVELKLTLDYSGKTYNTTLYVAARNLQ